jgi:hypothetical protein
MSFPAIGHVSNPSTLVDSNLTSLNKDILQVQMNQKFKIMEVLEKHKIHPKDEYTSL